MSKKKKPIRKKRNNRRNSSRKNNNLRLDNFDFQEGVSYIEPSYGLIEKNLKDKAKRMEQIIKNYLKKLGIQYNFDNITGTRMFHLQVMSSDNYPYPLTIIVDENSGNFGFLVHYFDFPDKYSLPAYQLVNTFNEDLPYGSFTYIREENLISYRRFFPLIEEVVKSEIFEFYLSQTILWYEDCLPILNNAANGIYPEEEKDQLTVEINKLLKNISPAKKSEEKKD